MSSDSPLVPPVFRGHIGRRIRYYRMQAELTQKELARRAGVNQGFLSEIERGYRKPSPSSLRALAVALDIAPAVLIGESLEHDAPQPLEMRGLPLFGTIPAGPPSRSDEQQELFPVLRHLWAPNRYVLRLTFDSMEPTLKPGDLVLVEYRPGVNPEHVQGRICACLIDQNPTLKRVWVERRQDHTLVILRGDNPSISPIVVDESTNFAIQGIITHLVSRAL
ncbi:MAG TPA: helix-turn-helix domain-containing protein [Phycisphaerae bacterium]|nr:helix-turn-helix domain-containing protein [Phycisphaerae bacterium]HOJ75687.1 helix-turn-helix domain-containing protein [Phycisphaerae bacterium]HOM53172.1 helix-turn-helix domain-containing protein [Phycisphaerae bacterium]HON66421.1 helix-turn-helix domain-containing protein [Phycisphaerae bacterium]HOQ87881.1 helix-turn-helix domain-containing protein [Phycisphaerae bacterium]